MLADSGKMVEIKACPFCGDINLFFVDGGLNDLWFVNCVCGASGQNGESKEDAVRLWNCRDESNRKAVMVLE